MQNIKNVKANQLKKCIFLTLEEFLDIANQLNIKTDIDWDGLSFSGKAGQAIMQFSEYFGVEITSIHCDDFVPVGIWIAYKEN